MDLKQRKINCNLFSNFVNGHCCVNYVSHGLLFPEFTDKLTTDSTRVNQLRWPTCSTNVADSINENVDMPICLISTRVLSHPTIQSGYRAIVFVVCLSTVPNIKPFSQELWLDIWVTEVFRSATFRPCEKWSVLVYSFEHHIPIYYRCRVSMLYRPPRGCRPPDFRWHPPHLTQSRPPLAGYIIHKVAKSVCNVQ